MLSQPIEVPAPAHPLFRGSRAAIQAFSRRARERRMKQFCKLVELRPGMRVLDLGGNPKLWKHVPGPLEITIVNLPGETGREIPSHHSLTFVEGDACQMPRLADGSFDLVFSNSVIEHVGDEERQAAFASEVLRLGKAYWVQTPSIWFPIEAHTGMPFWWFYPEACRKLFLRSWHRKLPDWSDSMAGTRVLTRRQLKTLFPGSQFYVESVAGIPKSQAAYCLEWRSSPHLLFPREPGNVKKAAERQVPANSA